MLFKGKYRYASCILLSQMVLIGGTSACTDSLPEQNAEKQVKLLLDRSESIRLELTSRFPDIDLLSIAAYPGAVESSNQARRLMASDYPSQAIPHAESTLALLDSAEHTIYQQQYQSMESTILALQLSLLKFPEADSLTAEAESGFRSARKEFQKQRPAEAVQKLEQSLLLYKAVLQSLQQQVVAQ